MAEFSHKENPNLTQLIFKHLNKDLDLLKINLPIPKKNKPLK